MNRSLFEQQQQMNSYCLAEKLNSQCVISLQSENNKNVFGMCTNSLRKQNEVHIIEYDDQINKITRNYITYHKGILEKIIEYDSQNFFICYKENFGDKNTYGVSFNKIELDKYNIQKQEKESLWFIKSQSQINSFIKHQDNEFLISDEHNIYSYDFTKHEKLNQCEIIYSSSSKISKIQLDPHHINILAIAVGNCIEFIDLRTQKECYKIKGHSTMIELDFNPNKQYQIITNSNETMAKIWEMRRSEIAVKTIEMNNMVLSSRFNNYHDQLILLSCDDGSLSLYKSQSTSSAPMQSQDYLVKMYDEHDDSVHSCAWSLNSAWIFASVAFNGNLVINSVPSTEKYSILL